MAERRHFLQLDALRGVAAICVMLGHAHGAALPQARLAVDFFFMLSGFVIAYSYEERLRRGMPFGAFILRRVIRLYPMIVIASVSGFLCAVFAISVGATGMSIIEAAVLSLRSLALLPRLAETDGLVGVFPLDTVLWSLFFEIIANAIYGMGFFRMEKIGLAAVMAASLALVVASGDVGGNTVDNFAAGYPRIGFGFFLGVLLYKASRDWAAHIPAVKVRWLGVALVGALSVRADLAGLKLIPVFAALAAIVLLAAQANDNGKNSASKALGELSYPLYAVHLPIYNFLTIGLLQEIADPRLVSLSVIAGLLFGALPISYLVFHRVDVPARRFLTRRLVTPASARASTALGAGAAIDLG